MAIQITDDQRINQPVIVLRGEDGIGRFGIAKGIAILDLTEVEFTPGDWTRTEIQFSVSAGDLRWNNGVEASVSVYPLTFDVGVMPDSPTDVGWGIDNAQITNQGNLTNGLAQGLARADVTATLVMKTISAEVLRIGWQVTFGSPAI